MTDRDTTPANAPMSTPAKAAPAKAKPPLRAALPRSARGTIWAGTLLVGVTFFGFGAWASYAPLASAVVASASIVSEGRTQTVQHLEGGIISELMVREGATVQRGDVLFRLDPVQAASRAERLRNQVAARRVQAARLMAERDEAAEITLSEALSTSTKTEVVDIIRGEQRLFEERRRSFVGQIELLEGKITQLRIEVDGLNVQEASKQQQTSLINDELDSLRPLLEKGLVARPRLLALERDASRLDGELGEIVSRRARANEAMGEARMEMVQLEQRFREEVVAELREVDTQISDLEQQLTAAEDVMTRLDIVAPASGIAQNVAITTVGGVISPGQPLLEIAPAQAQLVVAARVAPLDVHDVHVGQEAEVRFVALDVRRLPAVFGTIRTVSGDRIIDQATGMEYFLVQVEVPTNEMNKLGTQSVHAGMPAEILVQTGSRTFMDYLIRPLTDAMSRGLNEK